jgi:formate dehydrogenase subunit gamma
MSALSQHIRLALATLMLLVAVALVAPASAQQPSSVNPSAAAVKEDQVLRQSQPVQGRITIPDAKAATLIQPAGQSWRQFHEVTLHWLGGIVIVGALAIVVLYYLVRGMVRIEGGRSGRTVVRFSGFERFVHWMTASCFVVLALSGLNITFGKTLLAPLVGAESFAMWSQWAKYAHNYLSFPFTLGVVLMLLLWVAWSIPNAVDVEWFQQGGGLLGEGHPKAGRFNAGQ